MCDSCEMPKYKCIKTVHALKIKEIYPTVAKEGCEWDGSYIITPEESPYAPFRVSAEYVQKHQPVAGGYYVVYEDDYKSFSPADAFEKGYVPLNNEPDCDQVTERAKIFSFSEAIYELKAGKKVAREGWNGKGMWLKLMFQSYPVKVNLGSHGGFIEALPWIGMKTADNKFVPWLASQTDMLVEDWIIVE